MQLNLCNLHIPLVFKSNLNSVFSCNDSSFEDATHILSSFILYSYFLLSLSIP